MNYYQRRRPPVMTRCPSNMVGYASRTGTKRNLAALEEAGWRLIIEPGQLGRYSDPVPPLPYAIDNGAWRCYRAGNIWDEAAFRLLLDLTAKAADWIVAPDIVAGGVSSLRLSEKWLPVLEVLGRPILIAVQDGIAPADVSGLIGGQVGLFVGGSTEWKLDTVLEWGELASEIPCYLHVARVNSARRIRLCHHARADSFDGTSCSMYATSLPRLDQARRQGVIGWD